MLRRVSRKENRWEKQFPQRDAVLLVFQIRCDKTTILLLFLCGLCCAFTSCSTRSDSHLRTGRTKRGYQCVNHFFNSSLQWQHLSCFTSSDLSRMVKQYLHISLKKKNTPFSVLCWQFQFEAIISLSMFQTTQMQEVMSWTQINLLYVFLIN